MLLFLGDSITQRWDNEIFMNDFSQYTPINLGIDGFTTTQLLHTLSYRNDIKNLLQYSNLKLIVIMIGVNNSETPQYIANEIHMIVLRILHIVPDIKILLRGILPLCVPFENDYPRIRNQQIQVNNYISQFANDTNIFYMDNSRDFLDAEDSIIDELFLDHVHLSKEGYEVLSRTLTPYIKTLLE